MYLEESKSSFLSSSAIKLEKDKITTVVIILSLRYVLLQHTQFSKSIFLTNF